MIRSYASALALLTAALLVGALVLPACDSNDPGGDDDDGTVVSEDIGPDGGSLTSQDGMLTLTIPAGALGSTETITIEKVAADELSAEFDEIADVLGVESAYELGPDGLQFDEPVTASIPSDQTPVQDGDSLGVAAELLVTSDNGTPEALDSLRTVFDADAGTVTVKGEMDHFTPLIDFDTDVGALMIVVGVPRSLPTNQQFTAQAILAPGPDAVGFDDIEVNYADFSDLPVTCLEDPSCDRAEDLPMPQDDDTPAFVREFDYGCEETGAGLYGANVNFPFARLDEDLELERFTVDLFVYRDVECTGPSFTLNILKDGDGSGTVTSDPPGIDFGNDNTEDYEEGTDVTLTAEPGPSSSFDGWTGETGGGPGCDESPPEGGTCTVTMDQDRTVTATFVTADDDSQPEIIEFNAEDQGGGTYLFDVMIEFEGVPDNLEFDLDPGDDTGSQNVPVEDPDGDDQYSGSTQHTYDSGSYAATGTATNTETGESDDATTEIAVPARTLEVQIEGEGAVNFPVDTDRFEEQTCEPECTATFPDGFEVVLAPDPADGWKFDRWKGPVDGLIPGSVVMDEDWQVTAVFVQEEDGDVLEVGTKFVPIGALEAMAMFVLPPLTPPSSTLGARSQQAAEQQFGDLTGTFITGFSGAEGFTVIDLLDGEELLSDLGLNSDIGNAFGVIGLTETPPGPDSPATIFVFAQNGVGFFDTQGDGTTTSGESTFDGWPAGGDARSGWATAVQPDVGVRFIAFDEAEGLHTFTDETVPADQFDDQVVSAYLPAGDGSPGDNPILALDRAVESGLYLVERDGSGPQRVADVGLDARKIRCVDPDGGDLVCGITVFGDDEVALVTWDGQSTPTVEGTVSAGDGPVDLGLALLESGNVGLVTTGFNDDTVTEVELSPDGSVVQSDTRPVLDGCQSPGHAIYVRDDAGLKVVGTCFDSGNYFVDESAL